MRRSLTGVKVEFCDRAGSYLRYNCFSFFHALTNKWRNWQGRHPEGKFKWFAKKDFLSSPSCSPLPCLGQLALVAESLRQVWCWVVSGLSHFCLLQLCQSIYQDLTSSNCSWVSLLIIETHWQCYVMHLKRSWYASLIYEAQRIISISVTCYSLFNEKSRNHFNPKD